MLAAHAFLIGRQALADEELAQSGKPQVIIVKAVIEGWMGADFVTQGFRPFRPGEQTLLAERERYGERLSLPWGGEDGPRLICGKPGRTSASRGFNVGLPQIEIDDCVVVLSPEFGGGESDGIEPLGTSPLPWALLSGKTKAP